MINPPIAKKITSAFTIHNQHVLDEYAWLRDPKWPSDVQNTDIIEYLNAENDYFDHFMKPLHHKKDVIFSELKGMIKLDDQSTYVKKDNYYYYTRFEADKSYAIHCRKKNSIAAEEEIILDENILAGTQQFMRIGCIAISPNHQFLAYTVDFTGDETYEVKIYDLINQDYLVDEISHISESIVWHQDIFGFFYLPINENLRRDKVIFHKIGTDTKEDILVLHQTDNLYHVHITKSASQTYLFIDISGYEDNEVYIVSITDQDFTTRLFKPRQNGIFYSIYHNGDYFYVHTNLGIEGKKINNFRVARVAVDTPNDIWTDYIPEIKDQYLKDIQITQNYLLLNYTHQGLPLLKVKYLPNGEEKMLHFPDPSFNATIFSTNFTEDDIRVTYSSFSRPLTVYVYEFSSNKLAILKVQEIPSGFNPEEYVVERVWTNGTRDGNPDQEDVAIPITLLYKKSLFKKDGSNPLYMYGYGSYGITHPVSFRSTAKIIADRGFVFAMAHIRGGSDLGHSWYEAAKFLNKKRTFNDFIKSAEYLIQQKYTSKGEIVISGGSAGGLLIGAVINQKPELFKAAIAHVPFVDILNTMLDETLPLTPGEFKEWGSPKNPEYFEYIKSYSPYDNIRKCNYPTLMVTTGIADSRVGYWEAAKWVARLREKKTDNNIIILKTSMDAGHIGASGRFDYLKEVAEELVFIFNIYGS